jgi:hypothetical protein
VLTSLSREHPDSDLEGRVCQATDAVMRSARWTSYRRTSRLSVTRGSGRSEALSPIRDPVGVTHDKRRTSAFGGGVGRWRVKRASPSLTATTGPRRVALHRSYFPAVCEGDRAHGGAQQPAELDEVHM